MERPIIFSTKMVRAIREGRKTQTRRVIKPQPSSGVRESPFVKSGIEDGHGREIKLRYQPGDLLWVRETWNTSQNVRPVISEPYIYKADINSVGVTKWSANWHPSIHMPRAAARLYLTVKAVRVERVQDITIADIQAEGLFASLMQDPTDMADELRDKWKDLWQGINAKRGFSWDSNPWVWAIEFERRRRNWSGKEREAGCPQMN